MGTSGNGDSAVMLLAGRGRGFCGQIVTTGTSGNGDSDVMLLVGRGRGFCGQISTTGTSGNGVMLEGGLACEAKLAH